MPRICYTPRNFGAASLLVVEMRWDAAVKAARGPAAGA